MELANQLEIIVEHLVKILALHLCLHVNHRQMQANRPDVEPSDEHRCIVFICRLKAAALVPR